MVGPFTAHPVWKIGVTGLELGCPHLSIGRTSRTVNTTDKSFLMLWLAVCISQGFRALSCESDKYNLEVTDSSNVGILLLFFSVSNVRYLAQE